MKEFHLTDHLLTLAETIAPYLPGADRTTAAGLRQRALSQLRAGGLPKITDEAWRYTNLRAFAKTKFKPVADPPTSLSGAQLATLELPSFDRYRVVLVDGWLQEQFSMLDDLPPGVDCTRLKDVLINDTPSDVLQQLEAKAVHAEHGFTALSAALAADGVVLRLQAGVQLDKPLEILHITQTPNGLNNINHFVALDAGARLTLIERYATVAETMHMTNAAVDIELADSAVLEHHRIQNDNRQALHLGYATTRLHSNSHYRLFSIALGALLDRHEAKMQLEGAAAHCDMKGLYIGREKQHIDNYTTVIHASPDASSAEYYKGILDDRARAVFHGRIRVNPDAQRTNAQQQNQNLLLSTQAEAATKPQLEIYADDVKCSHGATVGYLEEPAVFYLRSRGLSEAEARTVLTEAFAADILNTIDLPPVKEHLLALVKNKLTGIDDYQAAA